MRYSHAGFACLFLLSSACESGGKEASKPKPSSNQQGAPRPPAVKPPAELPKQSTAAELRKPPEYWLPDLRERSLAEQKSYLLELLVRAEELNGKQALQIRQIFNQSERLGFGNPEVSQPAMTQQECFARTESSPARKADATCGHQNMVHLTSNPGSNCIDQFEFPNIQCEYPLVWVRASEAAALCEVLGKRLCDAHEWEGACAGKVGKPNDEYLYSRLPKGMGAEYRRNRRLLMEDWHNRPRELVWAYGGEEKPELCGRAARKSPKCGEASFTQCGTNNYPTGSFPECVSATGVYDQHGNVAEHMSFPLFPEELGGWGYTEMKGSWFIPTATHPDDCRWRAKNWHTTRITDPNSHNNYHLGFRCCVGPADALEDLPEK